MSIILCLETVSFLLTIYIGPLVGIVVFGFSEIVLGPFVGAIVERR